MPSSEVVKSELAKAKSLSEETRRNADLAIQSCEDTMRRQKVGSRVMQMMLLFCQPIWPTSKKQSQKIFQNYLKLF